MVNFTLLAGGSGAAFIATYLFNPEAGSLALTRQNPTGENPSWIGAHPTNASILYAVNEVEQGQMQSFTIGSNGILSTAIANVSSGGNGPAHLQALSTGEVAIMNFGGGNGRVVPTNNDPTSFVTSAANITFQAPKSNPHETVELPSGELLVPDLGADKIWRITKSKNGSFDITGSIAQPAGSGPRHIAVLDDLLFTLHETGNTLTTQNLSASDPSVVLSSLSVIPDSASKTAKFGAGEILLPPKSAAFPTRFIYCSNRNVSPDPKDIDKRGDTVAVFSVDAKGQLKLENQVFTGIQGPRGLAFSGGNTVKSVSATSASGTSTSSAAVASGSAASGAAKSDRATTIHGAGDAEFLAIGGQAGEGGVVIMRRTEGGKNLVEVAREKTVKTRTSFVWA